MTGHGASPLATSPQAAFRALRRWLRCFWLSLRRWSGDAAYETYLARAGEGKPLDAKAFYLDSLRRRYRGQPDRCC